MKSLKKILLGLLLIGVSVNLDLNAMKRSADTADLNKFSDAMDEAFKRLHTDANGILIAQNEAHQADRTVLRAEQERLIAAHREEKLAQINAHLEEVRVLNDELVDLRRAALEDSCNIAILNRKIEKLEIQIADHTSKISGLEKELEMHVRAQEAAERNALAAAQREERLNAELAALRSHVEADDATIEALSCSEELLRTDLAEAKVKAGNNKPCVIQ